MQTINERVRILRKELGLTVEAFGEKLGMSKSSVSGIENGRNGASEQTIRLICSTFGVDYFWLTEGKGDMFVDSMDALIDGMAAEKHWDDQTISIMKKLYNLPPDQFDIVCRLIDNLKKEEQ